MFRRAAQPLSLRNILAFSTQVCIVAATEIMTDIRTTLNFYKPNEDGSPPAPAYLARPETFERTPETRPVTVRDVSGDEAKYTLDKHGFAFVTSPSKEKDFTDPERIESIYYEEIDGLLKKLCVEQAP